MPKISTPLKFPIYCILLFTIMLNIGCGSSKVSQASANINANVFSEGIKGNWDKLGFQAGDHVPDFKLYDVNGNKFSLASELKLGKPVVLIGASYTCDVSRGNLPNIKLLESKYHDAYNFFMVYLIEPHPKDVPSPYSRDKKIWIVPKNIRDKVEADQPKTYQQRKDLSQKWKQVNGVSVPVLVDNANNYFWSNYGEAPNMVYVILPDDKIYYKQTWFNSPTLDNKLKTLVTP